jgi:hypothetical protein
MESRDQAHRVAPLLISGGCVVLAIVRLARPDLTIDTITLVLIAIAAIPWLGHIIESFELPGGPKVTYHKLEQRITAQDQRIAQAQGAARSAEAQAGTVLSSITATSPPDRHDVADAMGERPIVDLIAAYDEIRRTRQAGSGRTAAMTDIVSRMLSVAGSGDVDIADGLTAEGGARLAAYIALFARPDPAYLDALVRSVSAPAPGDGRRFVAQPFEQYWGLKAVRKILESMNPRDVSAATRDRLVALHDQITPSTDRHFEVSQLLRLLE